VVGVGAKSLQWLKRDTWGRERMYSFCDQIYENENLIFWEKLIEREGKHNIGKEGVSENIISAECSLWTL
jgi:hypothetical protein